MSLDITRLVYFQSNQLCSKERSKQWSVGQIRPTKQKYLTHSAYSNFLKTLEIVIVNVSKYKILTPFLSI